LLPVHGPVSRKRGLLAIHPLSWRGGLTKGLMFSNVVVTCPWSSI
jgi:hypothetical protein